MSEEEKTKNKTTKNEEEKKNLETIDFSDRKDRIQSPYSKKAILELGLDENKLYKLDKEKYLLNHPELKNASPEVQDKRYEHYNKRREEQIELAKQKRNELIEKENEEVKYIEEENKENDNIKKNDNNEIKEEEQSEAVKKELEKLEMMKKQQLGEIKNIIDYAYKMNEFKKKNEEKIKLQNEK